MGQELVAIHEKLAQQAEHVAQTEQLRSGLFISTKSGVLSIGDDQLPGNQMCVVIIDWIRENTFYQSKWQPGDVSPPTCYALARDNEHMGPHPSMQDYPDVFLPQHDECKGCPKNEWGSADTGRGKACANRRRLVLLPAGLYTPKKGSRDFDLDLFTDPQHFAESDAAFLKLPATSVEEWARYVAQLSAGHRLPPHGVITRLYSEPHDKHQFHIKFEMLEKLSDDLLPAVMARHEAAREAVLVGYQPPEETEQPQTGLRNLRRR
jgi:hypothetical protein